jgi:hypothetical protein
MTNHFDESDAELALRRIACCLGVGGYNAPTVDAKAYESKIIDEIFEISRAQPARAPLTDAEIFAQANHQGSETNVRMRRGKRPMETVECLLLTTDEVLQFARRIEAAAKSTPTHQG